VTHTACIRQLASSVNNKTLVVHICQGLLLPDDYTNQHRLWDGVARVTPLRGGALLRKYVSPDISSPKTDFVDSINSLLTILLHMNIFEFVIPFRKLNLVDSVGLCIPESLSSYSCGNIEDIHECSISHYSIQLQNVVCEASTLRTRTQNTGIMDNLARSLAVPEF